MYDFITRIDPADCVRRIICDVSTGDDEFTELASILTILPKEGVRVPLEHKRLAYEMKMAEKFGKHVKSVQACEHAFKCPLSGYEFLMINSGNDVGITNDIYQAPTLQVP